MTNKKEEPTDPQRISSTVLQRKFKITHEMAKSIIEYVRGKPLDDGWNTVIDKIPFHEEEVIVFGKPIRQALNHFEHFIAILDFRCGWKDRATGEYLFVKKWMSLPKEEVKSTKSYIGDELLETYTKHYGPPKINGDEYNAS